MSANIQTKWKINMQTIFEYLFFAILDTAEKINEREKNEIAYLESFPCIYWANVGKFQILILIGIRCFNPPYVSTPMLI
jgi:hypothetical protein